MQLTPHPHSLIRHLKEAHYKLTILHVIRKWASHLSLTDTNETRIVCPLHIALLYPSILLKAYRFPIFPRALHTTCLSSNQIGVLPYLA